MPDHPERRAGDKRADASEKRMDKQRTLLDWIAAAVVLLLIVCCITSLVAYLAAKQANHAIEVAQQVEAKDRDTSRGTAYRLCTRNRIDRAFAHSSIRKRDPEIDRQLMGPLYLPILNCEPNLTGHGATTMPVDEQLAFVKRWERGDLTAEERGVCPGSTFGGPPPGRC